jgi:hypothetical protein
MQASRLAEYVVLGFCLFCPLLPLLFKAVNEIAKSEAKGRH